MILMGIELVTLLQHTHLNRYVCISLIVCPMLTFSLLFLWKELLCVCLRALNFLSHFYDRWRFFLFSILANSKENCTQTSANCGCRTYTQSNQFLVWKWMHINVTIFCCLFALPTYKYIFSLFSLTFDFSLIGNGAQPWLAANVFDWKKELRWKDFYLVVCGDAFFLLMTRFLSILSVNALFNLRSTVSEM